MEHVTCDYCGAEESTLIYETADTNYGFEGFFRIRACQRCGHVFLSPRPTAAEIGSFYPAQYHPFQSLETEIERIHPLWTERAEWLTAQFGGRPGRVLDIGSGNGQFLLAMRQNRWAVVGNELDNTIAKTVSTRLQLPVHSGPIEALVFDEPFDLITMWDVLEHVASPKGVLSQIYSLLRPGGLLAINVPNWGSFERLLFGPRWIAIDAPRHLHHFSASTLSNYLDQAGFEIRVIAQTAPVQSLASNVLRTFGDFGLRQGRTKSSTPAPQPQTPNGSPSSSSDSLKSLVIRLAYLKLTPFNWIINLLGRGANLTVLAQKPDQEG